VPTAEISDARISSDLGFFPVPTAEISDARISSDLGLFHVPTAEISDARISSDLGLPSPQLFTKYHSRSLQCISLGTAKPSK
jgi:hypothetical protein